MESKLEKPITENQVVQEMISTEKTYNAALGLLEIALSIDVVVENNSLLLEFKPHISALKNISDGLLENVSQATHVDVTDTQRNALRVQRNQLLKVFFTAYKQYAELYKRYADEFKSNPAQFTKINKYLQQHSAIQLGLADHLIMPVQRGPRYALLVAATKKVNDHLEEVNITEFNDLNKLITDLLFSANSNMSAEEKPTQGYHFGDISRYAYGRLFRTSETVQTPVKNEDATDAQTSSPPKPYQFGDYTRSLFKKAEVPAPNTSSQSDTDNNDETASLDA